MPTAEAPTALSKNNHVHVQSLRSSYQSLTIYFRCADTTFAIWSMSIFFGNTLDKVASGVMTRPAFSFFKTYFGVDFLVVFTAVTLVVFFAVVFAVAFAVVVFTVILQKRSGSL